MSAGGQTLGMCQGGRRAGGRDAHDRARLAVGIKGTRVQKMSGGPGLTQRRPEDNQARLDLGTLGPQIRRGLRKHVRGMGRSRLRQYARSVACAKRYVHKNTAAGRESSAPPAALRRPGGNHNSRAAQRH